MAQSPTQERCSGVGPGGAAFKTNRRYGLSISMQIRNVTNHNNSGTVIGNITSPPRALVSGAEEEGAVAVASLREKGQPRRRQSPFLRLRSVSWWWRRHISGGLREIRDSRHPGEERRPRQRAPSRD